MVRFDDHVYTAGGICPPAPVEAIGRVVTADEKSITLACWITDNEMNGDNTDTYTIRLHPGVKVTRLREVR